MGVFTNLFQDEIDFIEEKYRIKILEIKNIDTGILNSNFYIETKNKKYILRIYEATRRIDEEEQELILLEKIAGFIPVSKAIKNIDNEYISIFKNKKIEEIYKMLFELSEGVPIAIVKSDIFNTIDLPIVARNHLVDGKSNNLWYEEIVPHQSRFYFMTIWEAGEDQLYEVLKKEICKTPVSFGGNNSVGNGYCSIEEIKTEEEVHNGK